MPLIISVYLTVSAVINLSVIKCELKACMMKQFL